MKLATYDSVKRRNVKTVHFCNLPLNFTLSGLMIVGTTTIRSNWLSLRAFTFITFTMVALWNSADHYIFALWFLLSFSFFLSFFPRLISAVGDWMCLPYFHTWCGLSANLGCRSETCYTRLPENTGSKKSPKNRHRRTIVQLCRAISLQLRHVSTIQKKTSSNVSSRCSHNMVNFGLLAAEIGPVVWGTPANFNGCCVLEAILYGI